MYFRHTILIIIINALCFTVQGQNWELKKNSNGIKIYTRQKEGYNLLEFKAETTVNASVKQVVDIIYDVNSYKNWMSDVKKSELIKKIDNSSFYAYYEISMPWPFKNRDIAVLCTINQKAGKAGVSVYSKPDITQKKEGLTRINIAEGYWKIESISKNRTELTYSFFSDPEGSFPTWLINMFIVDNSYKTMCNMKNIFLGKGKIKNKD